MRRRLRFLERRLYVTYAAVVSVWNMKHFNRYRRVEERARMKKLMENAFKTFNENKGRTGLVPKSDV